MFCFFSWHLDFHFHLSLHIQSILPEVSTGDIIINKEFSRLQRRSQSMAKLKQWAVLLCDNHYFNHKNGIMQMYGGMKDIYLKRHPTLLYFVGSLLVCTTSSLFIPHFLEKMFFLKGSSTLFSVLTLQLFLFFDCRIKYIVCLIGFKVPQVISLLSIIMWLGANQDS